MLLYFPRPPRGTSTSSSHMSRISDGTRTLSCACHLRSANPSLLLLAADLPDGRISRLLVSASHRRATAAVVHRQPAILPRDPPRTSTNIIDYLIGPRNEKKYSQLLVAPHYAAARARGSYEKYSLVLNQGPCDELTVIYLKI